MEMTFEISMEDLQGSTELGRAKMVVQIQGPKGLGSECRETE